MADEEKRESLNGVPWKGFCPLCPGEKEMYLNKGHCFECPQCHVQIGEADGAILVMGHKGMGSFQKEAEEYISAVKMLKQPVKITYDGRGANLCAILYKP